MPTLAERNRERARPAFQRWWAKVEVTEGCWLWLGAISRNGYGNFVDDDGRNLGAHRFAYEHFVGPLAPGQFVCHHCDVRRCVRWDHLFTGTHAENMADMAAKGRSLRGGRHHRAKLTDDHARAVLALAASRSLPQAEIAAQFGITIHQVSRIRRGRSWSHLREEAA